MQAVIKPAAIVELSLSHMPDLISNLTQTPQLT